MIQVLHVSAECYPAAKTGGLGDVVGSLPKYLTATGILSAAIIPKYDTKWIRNQSWVTVYSGTAWINWRGWKFEVQQHKDNPLGYPLFVVDIPGLFDRPGIYNDTGGRAYPDEVERSTTFQEAVLDWLLSFPWHDRPRVLHCHDHHTALIPFMVKYCPGFRELASIPTVFTIHNGQYQGAFGWSNNVFVPPYEGFARGFLDWNGIINPMATAVRTAWAVTTVSESYLYELHQSSLGLEQLFRDEWRKEWGIINGIDAAVWDPATDPMIQYRLDEGGLTPDNVRTFKARNKAALCEWFGFPQDLPIISFIGRMVGEKGVDLLPDAYRRFLNAGGRAAFLVLGTGETWTENQFRELSYRYQGRVNAVIDYNEALSHQIYAGSDFLIMPSRVEPCGLNQLYAMRYGTIPIVRSVGGLKDTVPDIGEPNGLGRGIRFDNFSLDDASYAIYRAASMWNNDPQAVDAVRSRIMAIDFSWENAVEQYVRVYRSIGATIGIPSKEDLIEVTPVAPTTVAIPAFEAPVAKPKKAAKATLAIDKPVEVPAPKAKKSVKDKVVVEKMAEKPEPKAKKVAKEKVVAEKTAEKAALKERAVLPPPKVKKR
jgi:starch synthase